jgi:glycogen debranching enzyme
MTEYPLDEVNTPQSPQFYIATKSAPVEDRVRVLKYGQIFAVFDRFGDIAPVGLGEQGIFFEGTRHLSESSLFLGNSSPLLLSSTTTADNCVFTADVTNVDVTWHDRVLLPRGTLHLRRSKVLWEGACYEQLRISNYGLDPVSFPVTMKFQSDFVDLFEVRGAHRAHRGQYLPPEITEDCVTLSYRGLDGVIRSTRLICLPAPQHLTAHDVQFEINLQPQQQTVLHLTVQCDRNAEMLPYEKAFSFAKTAMAASGGREQCHIESSNRPFNDWINRSVADIKMMAVGNPESEYPYAGVPWFSTVFGRDGIIVALECLWTNPDFAKGVLRHLAETQATERVPERDAEPGKILHESRRGEMAALGEVPFGRYYGAVDSTPLFVVLAGAYHLRTADLTFIKSLWPSIEAALNWIDQYGDQDHDGFVEYARKSPKGLVQQGWKDSSDSVFHADGALAEPPIALCEVQGYVYAAKRSAARLARLLGLNEKANGLEAGAVRLKEQFEKSFWCADLGTYALALDGHKKPCRVRTSNPGHCLYTEIVNPTHAAIFSETIQQSDSFSGWGIRTVSSLEARYNPISYHNGSIWPHDNALCAAGLARYGFKNLASRILTSFFDASLSIDLHRLPELFCGLERRAGESPTLYPVACSPQAWASGAIFLLLESCLGITVDAPARQVRFMEPCLPAEIPELRISQLKVNGSSADLLLKRRADASVSVQVLAKQGELKILAP